MHWKSLAPTNTEFMRMQFGANPSASEALAIDDGDVVEDQMGPVA